MSGIQRIPRCPSPTVPQLGRCSWGERGQNFGVGLLFSSFLLTPKKKGHRAKLVYLSPSSLLVFKKKATILKLPQGKGEFGWVCWAV